MAEYLRKPAKLVTMTAAYAGLVLMLFSTCAHAQELTDPTRPPASIAAQSGPPDEKSKTDPELQSVLISPTRRVAIIDGQAVALGEKYGEARVVKIAEDEVVLRNGQEQQVLKLFPMVEKRRKSVQLPEARKKTE